MAWGAGALGVSILMNSVSFLALFYMVNILGIEPAWAGGLIFVSKLFDVISDPVVGSWSDRLKSDKGRRRPFLLVGAFISAGAFALIFTTPVFANQVWTAAYVFVALLLYTLGYTLFNVPYLSMPSEMTGDYDERSSIHGYRMIFVSIGGLLAGSLAPLALEKLGRTSWGAYASVGSVGAVVILGSMLIAWAGTASARFTHAQTRPPKILTEIESVFANRHFLRLLAVKASQLIGVAAMQSAFAFYVLTVLQNDFGLLAAYGLVIGIGSILSVPLIVKLSERIGKRYTYVLSGACYVLVAASWYFGNAAEPELASLVRALFLSFAVAGNVIMAMSMLTDIINHAGKSSGVNREGVYTAFYSFVEKFTFAFGPLIVGFALSLAGFDPGWSVEQASGAQVRQALLLGVTYIPAAMGLLSIFLLFGYRLSKEEIGS